MLYGDARLMLDDSRNGEMNAGLGYRQIVDMPGAGRAIAGGHAWIDRRRSERHNTYYQATAGLEILGRDWDARVNGYLPLSESIRLRRPIRGGRRPIWPVLVFNMIPMA